MPRTRRTSKTKSKPRRSRASRARRGGATSPSPRAMMVELVTTAKGRQLTVSVRSVRSHRALFACSATDARGAELAMQTAERYCAERGLVLVMPANDTSRATQAA